MFLYSLALVPEDVRFLEAVPFVGLAKIVRRTCRICAGTSKVGLRNLLSHSPLSRNCRALQALLIIATAVVT